MKPAVWKAPLDDGLYDRIGSDCPQLDLLTFTGSDKINPGKVDLSDLSCAEPRRHPRSAIEDDDIIDFDEFENEHDDEDDDIDEEVDDDDFEDFDETFADGEDSIEEPYYDLSSEPAEGAERAGVSWKTTGLRNQSLSSS